MPVPFLGLVRRYRFFLVLAAIPVFFFLFAGAGHRNTLDEYQYRASSQRPGYGHGSEVPGLGTWDPAMDEELIEDEFIKAYGKGSSPGSGSGSSSGGSGSGSKWFSPLLGPLRGKSGRLVLITGGAGSLGQVVADELVRSGYKVHAIDIAPRPPTLHPDVEYYRGNILPSSSVLPDLLAKNEYSGILHFAAVSLEHWCAPKYDACAEVNVDGTRAVVTQVEKLVADANKAGKNMLGMRKGKSAPWVLLASSMDVFGKESGEPISETTFIQPVTALGRTKKAAEDAMRSSFDRAEKGANEAAVKAANFGYTQDAVKKDASQFHGAIVRFSEVYGYSRNVSIPSAWIPRLLSQAFASLPIQYDSDQPPLDLLHVDDAVAGVIKVVDHLDQAARSRELPSLETYNLVAGGKRWLQEEIVKLVRTETGTKSPVRNIGRHNKRWRDVPEYSNAHAKDVLKWEPSVAPPQGLASVLRRAAEASRDYTFDFIAKHCAHSTLPGLNTMTHVTEEDRRNHDLWKLQNCTANIGFNNRGLIHHVKCEDGKHCLANATKVDGYNWNATVWILEVPSDAPRKSNGRTPARFREEQGMGYLGIPREKVSGDGPVEFELYNPKKLDEAARFVGDFELEVAPDSSELKVFLAGREKQLDALVGDKGQTYFQLSAPSMTPTYDVRLNILCCPREGDWPLILDDAESADIRFGTEGDIAFNSSRRAHLCWRAEESYAHFKNLTSELEVTEERTAAGGVNEQAPARLSSKPDDWVLKDLPPCWNDCGSPTVCMQTGHCRCVQADGCPRRRENPLLALGRPKRQPKAPDGSDSPLGKFKAHDPILEEMASKVDWRDVLLPEGRAYIASLDNEREFIKVHVVSGYPREKEIESAECHKLQPTHCFSADSMMYKALRKLSVPANEADLVVLPVYQHCEGADFILHDVWHYAQASIPGINTGEKPVSLVMTHDWGICLAFTWEIWSARQDHKLYPDPLLKNTLVFSVMGDWFSPCYRPAQDVVVPPRSCTSPRLLAQFPTISSIKPVSERPRLLSWAGTYWGSGKSERLRLACDRGGAGERELFPGAGPQNHIDKYDDYLIELNTARFCPQPRGIAGWSPRVNDAIFAGCIPVLTSEDTHYPFAGLIDWSQISVRVHPTELDHIEDLLSSIPMSRLEQIQANIVAIRDAFIYPLDGHAEEELSKRGPMFFALHEAGMRLRTLYPSRPLTPEEEAKEKALEAQRKKEEEEKMKKEEEEQARKKQDEEKKKIEEQQRLKAEEEEAKRVKAEKEKERQRKEEEEREREKKLKEENNRKQDAKAEAERKKAEEAKKLAEAAEAAAGA